MVPNTYPDIQHLLPLARYAQVMRLDLAHIMQVGGANYPYRAVCKTCWTEAMRQELRESIAGAERMMGEYLGFSVAPQYISERNVFPWFYRLSKQNGGGYRGQFGRRGWPELSAKWHRILTLGRVELTELVANGPFWDTPIDSVNTQAFLGIADPTAQYDLSRIRVFWRLGLFGYRIEIRGFRIWRIPGGQIILRFPRGMLVRPDMQNDEEQCVDWADDSNFANPLYLGVSDLKAFYEDDLLEDALCYQWLTDECGVSCTPVTQRGCPTIVNADLSRVQGYPATWDGTTLARGEPTYWYPPDEYFLRYRAGWADGLATGLDYIGHSHSYDAFGAGMARAIVNLTNTLLPDDVRCGCQVAQQIWKEDRMLVGYSGSTGTTSYSRPQIEEAHRNPFGPTYGALQAWRFVKSMASGGAVVG